MSLEKTVVTLKLQSGKRFDGIAIKNAESKLSEFLDDALNQLEHERQIQLPDTEEELVHPSHFQVFDERRRQKLSLQLPLSQQPYLDQCLQCKETPVLLLISPIFLDAVEVDREKNVEKVLRRQTVSEGCLRNVKHRPPKVPTRSSSLISSSRLLSREAMIYMAGRMESTPASSRLKRVHSPSRLSIMSSDSFGYSEDLIENLFPANVSISGGSGDTNSVQSSNLASMDKGPFNRPTSAPPSRNHLLRRGSDATNISELADTSYPLSHTPENLSKPPSLTPDTASLGGGIPKDTSPRSSLLISQKARMESPSPQADVLRHPIQKFESWDEESDRPHVKLPLRAALSVPTSVVIEESSDLEGEGLTMIDEREEGEEMDECMELSSPTSTLERRGRRTKTPPTPTRIAAMGTKRTEREVSPGLLDRPLSPDQQGVSPVVSPASSPRLRHRKTRVATRKRTHKKSSHESDEISEEAGVDQEKKSFIRHRRTIYDRRSHVTSTFFGHGRVFGTIKTFIVDFEIQIADVIVQREIRGDYTVCQIKDNLWSFLREQGYILEEEIGFLGDPENFTFTYQMNGETYELYDEQQLFQTSTVAQLWRSERREKGTLNVEMKMSENKEEKTMNMEISAMIGIGLYQLQFANNDELDITRRKMVAVRRNAVRSRDPIQYCMETELMFQALPIHVQDQIQDDKILVRVYYREGSYQTFQMDIHTTADEFLPQVFPDNESKRLRLGIPAICDINSYVLKVTGEDSYIYGSCELIQFTFIVNCLSKKNEIELALVKKVDPSLDNLRDIPDCNLIDNSTGLTGTHSDLSALSKEHTQVFTMSMWDIQRKFRIRVVGLDNFRSPDVEVVYIEAGIYHGGELLVGEKSTSEVSSTTYPRWNQWLVFDIAVKNLPKAARLCIQVVGGTRAKEVKRKSLRGRRSTREDKRDQVDKPLHWVNMQILDHRSLLRQGVQGLNLWPILPNSSNTFSPMGSTAINPDGNHSAVLYIELDSYAHPVACPTGGWGESAQISIEAPLKEGSRFWKDLEKSIRTDPLVQLDKAQQELIWKFRAHCSTIPEALPKLLRCVDWADLDQVCEVHRLLKIWRPITLEVALELLDYHFADEKVRSLAVRRLEKLSIGEVLCFLLQLIQVLKFEPYHDSALARFLLKKALQSKRVGHFFYWYLRSEMDTPEFNQRFGILLEAYLRGCGEKMFQEIQNQHKAVCDLMQVAGSVKRYLDGGQDRKKVIDYAHEQLNKYQLPAAFCPPYDPTLKMGALNITKSRVMDSKKSPLWLEFQNMDPTVVTNRPIKVIAKHGDDLRQDMLTLQMLALMDKMWQARGLDLYIIPYGCIATGNNMGVIQVVQEAETVAKIQLKYGGSFSALKEEPLHDWLKKQNPSQNRFDAAVERFMLSCAGYCVATYVLGIGDRHNDNIMVTTSGNLFHIDFGHFLGHKKEFLGLNRERAPFVLTPDFEYVMGKRNSEIFRRFEETAVKAYMIIRENANLFINLFSMMKCTGIPELRSVEDIEYLRSVLVLDKNEKAAEEHFKSQIQKCQKVQWSTQINWLTHNLAHRN